MRASAYRVLGPLLSGLISTAILCESPQSGFICATLPDAAECIDVLLLVTRVIFSMLFSLLLLASCYRHKANERCCVLVTVCVVLTLRRRPAEFQHEHEHPPL